MTVSSTAIAGRHLGANDEAGRLRTIGRGLAVGANVILLDPTPHLVGFQYGVKRGMQQNDSLADG